MIRRAAENISAAGVKADLAVMDCQNIQYHDESFDLVVCRDLTWTLADPVKAYKEWTRVLRKGGVLLVFDACWYLHLFDEKRMKVFEEYNNNLRKKYGHGIFDGHKNTKKCDELSKKLFMSDKHRPYWDMEFLISLGYRRVFAEPRIDELVRDEKAQEFYKLFPEFLVGGIK